MKKNLILADNLKVYQSQSLTLHIIDVPLLPFEIESKKRILIAAENFNDATSYIVVKTQFADVLITKEVTIGRLVIEEPEMLTISIIQGKLIFHDNDSLNMFNFALIGNEIIKFNDVTINQVGDYEIKIAERGLYGTSITPHKSGERFILLNNKLTSLNIPGQINICDLTFTDTNDNKLNLYQKS